MTTIRDRILARDDLNDMRAARDITGLAAALNQDPPLVPRTRFVTAPTVMNECADGAAILNALDAASGSSGAVRWTLVFLSLDSGLDVSTTATRALFDQLAQESKLTTDQAEAVKALALQPDLVTQEQVADALYNADGTEKT